MRVLILEDDPVRHGHFRRRFVDPVIVETARAAIELLAKETWDALFLDHDLGGEVYVQSGPGTGYEVAAWLEEHPDRQPPRIFLHTLNPAGRKNMQDALPNATALPFAWMATRVREALQRQLEAIEGSTAEHEGES